MNCGTWTWGKPTNQLSIQMPDVVSIKKELSEMITGNFSVSYSIRFIVAKHSLRNFRHRGNAWIDDICIVHAQL